jgi:hypothetical protein
MCHSDETGGDGDTQTPHRTGDAADRENPCHVSGIHLDYI